jgi:4'-phosphopantetheinyl transferase
MRIRDRAIHLWCVRLTGSLRALETSYETLSPSEKQRAEAFRYQRHRTAFVLSHGVLRTLLGRYLNMEPGSVSFTYNPYGKPSVGTGSGLDFNLSHSGDMALYGFAHACPLGVDVEQVRSIPEMNSIAAQYFSPEECAELSGVDEMRRSEAFFNCWTRKEAYIKAIGHGLALPLKTIPAADSWSLCHLVPAPGYIGALAYAGAERPVEVRKDLAAEAIIFGEACP